jgi:hypothetical protein
MQVLVKMKYGSHLYGTSTPDSDQDFKGVFLPEKRDILLNQVKKSNRDGTTKPDGNKKNTKDDIDIEFYSLHYFIKMACEGQTVALDMLHAPIESILQTSDIWEEIRKNKDLFYTTNFDSFVNYAKGQAAKYGIKGSRLNAAKVMIDFLKTKPISTKLTDIWDELPEHEHIEMIGRDPNGFRQLQICNRKMQESIKVEYALEMVQKFYNTYGTRAVQAAENKGIDWKAISHAFRAAFQLVELFTNGTITYPLESAPFLKKLKNGEINYQDEAAPKLEKMVDEIRILAENSKFPTHCNVEWWENWVCDTVESVYYGRMQPTILIPNPETDSYDTMGAFKKEFNL